MRTIKFRGKRVDNDEWIFGYFVLDPLNQYRIYWKPFSEAYSNTYHFVIPETVGQFTGLTDKNGTEIFEGDKVIVTEIINGKIHTWENEVCFKNGCFSLVDKDCCEICKNGFGITCNLDEFNLSCEVIGNIHDK